MARALYCIFGLGEMTMMGWWKISIVSSKQYKKLPAQSLRKSAILWLQEVFDNQKSNLNCMFGCGSQLQAIFIKLCGVLIFCLFFWSFKLNYWTGIPQENKNGKSGEKLTRKTVSRFYLRRNFFGKNTAVSYWKHWSGREDLNLRPPGPELGWKEPISLVLKHLGGASSFSFLPIYASFGAM